MTVVLQVTRDFEIPDLGRGCEMGPGARRAREDDIKNAVGSSALAPKKVNLIYLWIPN